ncbi:hypothetical protein [Spirosoma oryzicola]|uniref:hypothetical protein n=1 Tax=Spirosoma oryzicola TaxID=2898794 RepID=UPI001E3F7A04|nr:hypothetical protein [Spirosoma oryzicola]UHG94728.1 hypothetical protein LQ777_28725 [Spirosoma oryzicola]
MPYRLPYLALWFIVASLLALATTMTSVWAQSDSLAYGGLPHEPVRLNQPENFTLFAPTFYQQQLFLLGESHGIQQGQALDFALLKHLNQRTGLRYYLAELDATKAAYVNRFLETGDEKSLQLVFRSWIAQTAQWANQDYLTKLRRVRALNQRLPRNRRIRWVGIDRIQDKPLVAQELVALLGKEKLPESVAPLAESLWQSLQRDSSDRLVAKLATSWLAQWPQLAASFHKSLGARAQVLHERLLNMSYLTSLPNREAILFANFKALLPRLGREKLYGLWGFFHVLQSPLLGVPKPFACLVKESDLAIHDKLVSLSCSYLDSYMMMPTQFLPPDWQDKGHRYSRVNQFNNDGPLMQVEGIKTMRAATQANTLTVFALDRPESFARTTPLRIRYSAYMPKSQQLQFDPHRPITDYFQYIILVRNSEMTQPIAP